MLISAILLGLVACGDTKGEESNAAKITYGQVWSAPSTVKIKQDDLDYADKGAPVLAYQAVRNEYENMQLFITAEKEISRFELQTSELKCGDASIAKENIDVYVQKYTILNDEYGANVMPDALLPMDAADSYGENKIYAGCNGGLWITVYIPEDTPAGLYEGTFQLVVDGNEGEETMPIPVSVHVYDYTLASEPTAKTLFSWRYERVAVGELDGSIEMMEKYYEFFLDYRISLQSLPIEILSGEEFVASVKKYWDRITTYSILSEPGEVSLWILSFKQKVEEQILALAKESTPEWNLFDKAALYIIDEPKLNTEAGYKAFITKMTQVNELLQSCVDIIKADETDTYQAFKQIENWEESILGILNLAPGARVDFNDPRAEEFWSIMNSFCPTVKNPVWKNDLKDFVEYTEKNNLDIERWWYTLNSAFAPLATYHIGDDNLLSSRTLSWLQLKYNISGNLYWDAAAYTDESHDNRFLDVYVSPYRIPTNPINPGGDGFLTYPGAKYGVYGPLPSLRLMSIRDGMEEYELLKAVQDELKTRVNVYGADFSVEQAMERFYRQLAGKSLIMYKDGEYGLDFVSLRQELLQMLVGLEKGMDFVIGNIETKDNKATITYFVPKDATITIGGKEQQPIEGLKYQYVLDLAESTSLQATVSNQKGDTFAYDSHIAYPVYMLNALDNETVLASIYASDGGTVALVSNDNYSTDGTAVHVKVKGVSTGNIIADSSYSPSVSLETMLFDKSQITDLKSFSIDIYNPGESFNLNARLYSGDTYLEFDKYEIASGKNTLMFDIAPEDSEKFSSADTLVFELENMDENGNVLSYEFYMDNIQGYVE